MSKSVMCYGGVIRLRVCPHADVLGLIRHWNQAPRMEVDDEWELDGDVLTLYFVWTGKGGHPADMRRRVHGPDGSTTVRSSVASFGVLEYLGTDAEHWVPAH